MSTFIYNHNFARNIWVGGKFKMTAKKRHVALWIIVIYNCDK